MTLPAVSCVCPTFGRTALLEEAVESFLRQDYGGESELLVINDFAWQKIYFDHPKVRIVNLPKRCATLGQKRQLACEEAQHELLLTWGDDDIHLPHRISRMVEVLGDQSIAQEGWHYCSYAHGMFLNRWSTAGANIMRKSLLEAVGGFAHKDTGEDVDFNARAEKYLGKPLLHAKGNPAFVYRWHGTNRYHVSGTGQKDPYRFLLDYTVNLVKERKEPRGNVHLKPTWRQNYLELVTYAQEVDRSPRHV